MVSAESIVDGIANGDKQAEHQLVDKYWKSLFFVLQRQVSDAELAQDLAQETFIVVINKARSGQIENPAALGKFIRQVGVNLLIANFRKETRRKTDACEDIEVQFSDEYSNIQQALNSEQLTELVKQVMNELPTERDRDLLYRYFVYGQDKGQICQEFELTPEHFDRVLYRARNRLKQVLQVKLNVSSDKIGLSHLLSVFFVLGLSQPLDASPTNISDNTFFTGNVRGFHQIAHVLDIVAADSKVLPARKRLPISMRWS